MDYRVVKKISINKSEFKKIGAFWYQAATDSLYFESPWPFPVQLMIAQGLNVCRVTPGFLKLPFILKGWINLDILLREIELMKLALGGKILMHGSCVDNTLIVGFPNAGKTYQTYKMVSEGGMLVSEEYTVIHKVDGHWNAAAYKPVMRTCFSARTIKDCKIQISLRERIWLFFTTIRAWLMPFMFEAVIWKELPVTGRPSRIDRIVYGSSGEEVKDWKKFAILCENEFPFMSSEFLQAHSHMSGLDLLGIQAKQRLLIKEFVEHVYPSNGK